MRSQSRRLPALARRACTVCAALAALLPVGAVVAQAPAATGSPPLTLEQAMALAKPESFGTSVFSAWWTADGRQLVYQQLPAGGGEPATYTVAPADGSIRLLDAAAVGRVDPEERSVDAMERRVVYARDGIVLRELSRNDGVRLTSEAQDRDPRFSADGERVFFRRGADWWVVPVMGKMAARPLLQVRAEQQPPAGATAANDAGAAVYLGPQVVVRNSWLSPDGRHALVATTPKGYDAGRVAQMPKYITPSGCPEMENQLPHVGRNPADGRQVVAQVATHDHRDVWLAAVDPASGTASARHHLAGLWVLQLGFGFLPDGRLWFQSESGGAMGLYVDDGRSTRAVVDGPFEAAFVQWSPDGKRAYFTCNRRQPTDGEVCRVEADGSGLRELTALDGGVGSQVVWDAFRLSPDGRQLAVRHSGPLLPMQLSLVDAETGATRPIADTRGEAMKAKAAELVAPRFVPIPSSRFKGQLWGKLHRPETLDPARRYPLVLILHGGNTVQGAGRRLASQREALFAQFLVAQGYLVLEVDYRGSAGYGRDFRAAVHGRLRFAEIEDYRDAVDYMVAQHPVGRDQVGAYGCSYGGHPAYMAAFQAPDVFKAVAAANGWSDWTATRPPSSLFTLPFDFDSLVGVIEFRECLSRNCGCSQRRLCRLRCKRHEFGAAASESNGQGGGPVCL